MEEAVNPTIVDRTARTVKSESGLESPAAVNRRRAVAPEGYDIGHRAYFFPRFWPGLRSSGK